MLARGTKIDIASADPEWLRIVRSAMGHRGYDQAQLARAVNVSEATVSRLLSGRSECSDQTARNLARVLHVRLPLQLELGADTDAREWAAVGARLRIRDRAMFARLLAAARLLSGEG